MGCADQACESERVSPGISGQVLKCKGQELAPGVDRVQILVGHACVIERARQVEAEVVGGAKDPIGSGSGFD